MPALVAENETVGGLSEEVWEWWRMSDRRRRCWISGGDGGDGVDGCGGRGHGSGRRVGIDGRGRQVG